MCVCYLLELLYAACVDDNLTGSTLPPGGRLLKGDTQGRGDRGTHIHTHTKKDPKPHTLRHTTVHHSFSYSVEQRLQ